MLLIFLLARRRLLIHLDNFPSPFLLFSYILFSCTPTICCQIAESTGAPDSAVLAGQFSLQRAKVYPTMWAPEVSADDFLVVGNGEYRLSSVGRFLVHCFPDP